MTGISGRILAIALASGLSASLGNALGGLRQALAARPYYVPRYGHDGPRPRGAGRTAATFNDGRNKAKRERRALWKEARLAQLSGYAEERPGIKAPKRKNWRHL